MTHRSRLTSEVPNIWSASEVLLDSLTPKRPMSSFLPAIPAFVPPTAELDAFRSLAEGGPESKPHIFSPHRIPAMITRLDRRIAVASGT